MAASGADQPTVEVIYQDYVGRRKALIKALTIDAEEFWKKCDPEKENLCLYGYPNGEWEVRSPSEVIFQPEPAIGINFARDDTERMKWLFLVAFHCDSWLMSLSFFRGAGFRFSKEDRERLFNMMNVHLSVTEIVSQYEGTYKEHWLSDLCGVCGEPEGDDEFWIMCETCETWFHGDCVEVTAEMAKDIEHYECRSCIEKKAAAAAPP